MEEETQPIFVRAIEPAATGVAIPATPEQYAEAIAFTHRPDNTKEMMQMFAPGMIATWGPFLEKVKNALILKAGRDARVFDVMTFTFGEVTSYRTVSQDTWLGHLLVVGKAFDLFKKEGIAPNAMYAKMNTSDLEQGFTLENGECRRVKVSQTVHRPHAHITALEEREIERIRIDALSNHELRYVDRRFLPEFNEHVINLAKKYNLAVSGFHTIGDIPKIAIESEKERIALKSLYDEIYDLWKKVSLAITALDEEDIRKNRLFSEEGLKKLQAEGKLGSDGRPRFLPAAEAISQMEKLISQFGLEKECPRLADTLMALATGNLKLKADEVFRFGPNFGIIITSGENDSLEVSFIPSIVEGKGPDPTIGILTWDERRALDAAESREIADFSRKLIDCVKDELDLWPVPWSAIKYARSFESFEKIEPGLIALMISEWTRRLCYLFTQPGLVDSERFIEAKNILLSLHPEASVSSPYHDYCLLELGVPLSNLTRESPIELEASAFEGTASETRLKVSLDKNMNGAVSIETDELNLSGNLADLTPTELETIYKAISPLNEFFWSYHRAATVSGNEVNEIKNPSTRIKTLIRMGKQQRFRATG